MNTQKTAMILAGGLMFAGSAGAAVSSLSSFEADDEGWTGYNTYAYSDNYTLTAPSGSGLLYGKTNSGSLTKTIDITAGGADTAAIAAGNMEFDFSAYLGSYTGNPDRSEITYQFFDAGNAAIGTEVLFDDGSTTPNGTWTQYGTTAGAIPTNAASVFISANNSRTAGQTNSNDGYVDLVSFSTTQVPEPSSAALLGLGGLALILRRRKG